MLGAESCVYMALACVTDFIFTGHTGMYCSQFIGIPKLLSFGLERGKLLSAIGAMRRLRLLP